MKGKKLLSLITAGAIATTVGVSFAAWDKLDDSATASINVAKQVTVDIPSEALTFTGALSEDGAVLGAGALEADLTVNIANLEAGKIEKLTFEATGAPAGVTVAVLEDGSDVTAGDSTLTAENAYKVKVSIAANATDDQIKALAEAGTANFTLKATAVPVTTAS